MEIDDAPTGNVLPPTDAKDMPGIDPRIYSRAKFGDKDLTGRIQLALNVVAVIWYGIVDRLVNIDAIPILPRPSAVKCVTDRP